MSNRIALATAHDAREDFINEAGGASKDDFIAYGKDVVQPGREYYKKTYLAGGRDLYVFRKAMEGASVLNPFTLKTLSLEQAQNLVPPLKYSGFKHFTKQFLGKLKTQMSSLIEAANSNTTGIPLRELPNTTFLFLRLVGLVQVLSASVERLFSQLKLVVNAVGPAGGNTRGTAFCPGEHVAEWMRLASLLIRFETVGIHV